MQFKLHNSHAVKLSEGDKEMYFLFSGPAREKIEEENPLLVGPVEETGVFSGPGEYEVRDISIVALETKDVPNGVADLYKVTIEGVHCLFVVNATEKIEKQDWDLIGEVDIVVFDPSNDDPELAKFLKKVEPFIIIATGSADSAQVERLVGQPVSSSESKLKFAEKDFSDEEAAIALHILTK